MNLSALNNITPYTVNNSLINETTEIGANLISNGNTQTQGYLGLGIMITLFLVLLIILMADQDIFRLPFINSLIASSGLTLLVGITLLVSDIASSYQHVMWIAIIFIVAILGKFYENK